MIVDVVVQVEYKDSNSILHSLYPLQVQVQGVTVYRSGKLNMQNFKVWIECVEVAVMRGIDKKFEGREYKVLEWSLGDT